MTPFVVTVIVFVVLVVGLWFTNRRIQVNKNEAVKLLLDDEICLTKHGVQLYKRTRSYGYSILDLNEAGMLTTEEDFPDDKLDEAIEKFLSVSGGRKG